MVNKQRLKRSLNPLVVLVIRTAHLKIFGKHVFANKYVKKLPGVKPLLGRIDVKVSSAQTNEDRRKEYHRWFKQHYPNKSQLAEQASKQKNFKKRPLISIVVPTYNTNIQHLRECIDSVLVQTYDNWQLCLADDASTNDEVRTVIKGYADQDERIVYTFREKNGHICEASNSALELAKGTFVALLDHDDYLWPNALFEVVQVVNKHPDALFVYSDEDKIDDTGKQHEDPFFKPDWSFEFLRSINYITHFAVLSTKLVKEVGGFRPGMEGAQDWDLFLRASRKLDYVYHVPTVLYSWRKSATSTAGAHAAKDYAYKNQEKALQADIKARGMHAKVGWQIPFSMWRVDYELKDHPLVSIVIPTKDQYDFMERCLRSMKEKTTYDNFEVVITDTGSTDPKVWQLYEEYKKVWPTLNVVKWEEKPFNFAAACDFGADHAKGEYLLFLNNDTEVISESWLQDMLGYAQQKDVGAVGCKLFYPDGKLQHGGIILGVGGQNGTPGIAGHYFPGFRENPPQDPAQLTYVGGTRNFTAVTAAAIMVSKAKFDSVKGFDPKFQIAFNDVDFCLKLYDKGLRNVYLPHVTLFHHESISVGLPGSKVRNEDQWAQEIQRMIDKWGPLIKNDPFYHPDFRRDIASARLDV